MRGSMNVKVSGVSVGVIFVASVMFANDYICYWRSPRHMYATPSVWGLAVAKVVEALRYKQEGRGFDSRWRHWIFFLWHNLSGSTVALGSTQLLTVMSTRNISRGGKDGRPVRKAENLTTFTCRLSRNPGALELSGPVIALYRDFFNFALLFTSFYKM